jgi:apolipoprotein N-acyltransferase
MFPEIVTARMRRGADFIINLTNDSWIPSVEFGEHQLVITAMRAVEQRRFLVRASTSGPSAIISPDGRIVTRTDPMSRAILFGDVTPLQSETVYARYGDWFAWTCLASLLVACVVWSRSPH